MTQTPRRSGIRLPWSHEDEIEGGQQAETEKTPAVEVADGAPESDAPAPVEPAAVAPAVEPAEPDEQPSEADNALLASLVAAMREVAERERTTSVASLKSAADEAIERLRSRAAEGAEQLRNRADLDVAGIGDWVKAETERIEAEGRTKTETRRQQLSTQVAEHEQRSQREIEGVRTRVANYERELSTFFTQLYEISDPAAFGTAAKRMPRPPALGVAKEPTTTSTAPGPGSEPHAAPETPAGDVAPDATQAPEATSDETAAPAEAGAASEEAPVTTSENASEMQVETLRDRMDALGIDREPAPMPGEGAEPQAAEESGHQIGAPSTSSDSSGLAARLRELDARIGASGTPEPATAVASAAPGGEAATAITVSGLGSFGAITSFKQALERVEGVHGISLSLGPTGEFVYRATHGPGFDLAAAIEQIERGTAKIDRQADGSLRVTVQRAR